MGWLLVEWAWHGITVLEKGTAFGSLTSTYNRNSSRILVANFAGNPAVTVGTADPDAGQGLMEDDIGILQ